MKNLLSRHQGRGNQNAFSYHGVLVAEKNKMGAINIRFKRRF